MNYSRVSVYEMVGPSTRRTVARVFVPGVRIAIEIKGPGGSVRTQVFDVSGPVPKRSREEGPT